MKLWPAHLQSENFWKTACLCAALLFNLAAPACAEDGKVTNQVTQAEASEPYISPTNGLGSWIWASNTFNGQTCQLWRTFEIPASAKITKARLAATIIARFRTSLWWERPVTVNMMPILNRLDYHRVVFPINIKKVMNFSS